MGSLFFDGRPPKKKYKEERWNEKNQSQTNTKINQQKCQLIKIKHKCVV